MKNSYHKLLFFLLIFGFFGCTPKKSDSSFVKTSEDSLAIYFSLANEFNLSREKRLEYSDKAFEIVNIQKNDSINRVNLFKVANRYYNLSNWNGYKKTVGLVLEKSEEVKDTVSIAKACTYFGDYYDSQSIPDSAFLFYHRAEKIYDKLGDNLFLGKTLINKANLLYRVGDFIGSEKEVFSVLRIIKDEKNIDNLLYETYNLLGLIYNGLGEYENALAYNNKALSSINDKTMPEEFQSRATSYNNIGLLYLNMSNNIMAKDFFRKGLEQENLKNQKPYVYTMLLNNLAYAKFKEKDFEDLPDLFYESLKMSDSLRLTAEVFSNKIHLSEYFLFKNETSKSLKFSREALTLAKRTNVARDILVALKQMAILEPQNASIYTKEYIRINEQLQKEERKMGDKFSRIQYETDIIKDENSNLTEKNQKLVYIFSFVTILGLFLYIIKSQKAKNRELLYKQEQQHANEEIYNLMISQQNTIETNRVQEKKRVAQELHDGVLGRMFGVRMNLDGLNRYNDDLAIEQRNNYLVELKNIEQDIREISHDLNREKSELINNFVAIVDNLFEEQRKTFPSKLISTIDVNIKWEIIPNAIKINLFRIMQESLQNINKYANANLIKVELKKQDGEIVLVISDDGVGFNANLKKKGIGLLNMQSRTNECKGKFSIQSKIGEGAIVTVTVPIEPQQIST